MTVEISPNIKKESQRVNLQGIITDPKTKEVIGNLNEKEYIPTQAERIAHEQKGAQVSSQEALDTIKSSLKTLSTGSSELDAKINEKVETYRKQLIEKAKQALDNL